MSSKFFLKSKTVIGALIMAAPEVLPVLGATLGISDADADLINGTLDAVIQLVGFITLIIGRLKASGTIHFVPQDDGSVGSPATAVIVAFILAVLLGGCAGAVPWNKQNYAGITSWDFNYCKVDVKADADGSYSLSEDEKICGVEVIDGKERGSVQLDFILPDGTIMNYLANDEVAFEGQRIRAEVETAVADALAATLPALVETAIKAALPIPD